MEPEIKVLHYKLEVAVKVVSIPGRWRGRMPDILNCFDKDEAKNIFIELKGEQEKTFLWHLVKFANRCNNALNFKIFIIDLSENGENREILKNIEGAKTLNITENREQAQKLIAECFS